MSEDNTGNKNNGKGNMFHDSVPPSMYKVKTEGAPPSKLNSAKKSAPPPKIPSPKKKN